MKIKKPSNKTTALFSSKARWIWDGSDRLGYNYYLRASRAFTVSKTKNATLRITADALYQVWLNGMPVGHGPAKSAEGKRSVDSYDIEDFIQPGENVLEVLVLSIGVGTMTYCLGDAGLIFEIRAGSDVIVSDENTLVSRDSTRLRPTVRKWILPCIEDIDSLARESAWVPATVVNSTASLYARRVALPSREPVYSKRLVSVDRVDLPNFQVGFRIKPSLVSAEDALTHEIFDTPATFRMVINSPVAQTLRFTPTLGSAEWTFKGKKVFNGSGWRIWDPAQNNPIVRLKAGRNEFIGRHVKNHFEYITLAGFVSTPVTVEPLKIECDNGPASVVEALPFSNGHDLSLGAEVSPQGEVKRTIWDLGAVYTGWVSFDIQGAKGDSVLLSMFEAMEGTRIQWPDGCNNVVIFRTNGERQGYETFHVHGVRYIAVHELGEGIKLSNLRVLKASCSVPKTGYLQTNDPLVNGIYNISAQCLESAMDDTFTDCPTFEQVNWNFDNRLASMADFLIYSNVDICRNSIQLFAEDPACHGLVQSQTPSAWRKDPIPWWSFSWIIWCWNFYWQTGDTAFAKEIFSRAAAGVDEAIAKIGDKGLMEWPGVWHFVEWGYGRDDDHAINTAEQAGLVASLDAVTRLAKVAGVDWDRSEVRAKLVKGIQKYLWDAKRQVYVDSLHSDGKRSEISSQLTNAIMALYGIGGEAWAKKLAKKLAEGTSGLLPFGSPFGSFYMLELFDKYDMADVIFEHLGHRWGDMVYAGDGTTWETFAEYGHGSWPTRSRCHPFSTFVVKYFVKYLLGVEATEAGYTKIKLQPRPPANFKFTHGAVPTPHGVVKVSWKRQGKALEVTKEIPSGVKLVS